jgi:hypothetical protein
MTDRLRRTLLTMTHILLSFIFSIMCLNFVTLVYSLAAGLTFYELYEKQKRGWLSISLVSPVVGITYFLAWLSLGKVDLKAIIFSLLMILTFWIGVLLNHYMSKKPVHSAH